MQYIDKSELAQEPALSLAPIDMNFHEFVTKEEVDPETGLSKSKDVLEIRPECKGKLITSLDELKEYQNIISENELNEFIDEYFDE